MVIKYGYLTEIGGPQLYIIESAKVPLEAGYQNTARGQEAGWTVYIC
jgi:hypothetical protein